MTDRPQRVVVIGAGMLGLATTWFLQQRDVEVTVLDKTGVAAGSSWGNAGWLTPGIAAPLPEPAVLRYGIRAMVSPASPVYVPLTTDRQLLRFLLQFVRNSRMSRWRSGMASLIGINALALDSYDLLAAGGVSEPTHAADNFIAAYRTASERKELLAEIEQIGRSGMPLRYELLSGDEARAIEPSLSVHVNAAIRIYGQRYIDPPAYVAALAAAVRARGARIIGAERAESITVDRIVARGNEVEVAGESYDQAVIAAGAWSNRLGRPFGVKIPVQAGRGYSFSVAIEQLPTGPLYFPAQRLACTPIAGRLRIAGMMEFRPVDAALDRRRIAAIVAAVRPLLSGADLESRRGEWVGPRPCTPDGLPVIGRTSSERVFIASGHGMWGMTLGPASGRLLAELMTTGTLPRELKPFDPLR